jgi:hypothetical protein
MLLSPRPMYRQAALPSLFSVLICYVCKIPSWPLTTLEVRTILVATNLAMKEISKVQGERQGSVSSCSSTGSRMEDGVAISSSTNSPANCAMMHRCGGGHYGPALARCMLHVTKRPLWKEEVPSCDKAGEIALRTRQDRHVLRGCKRAVR